MAAQAQNAYQQLTRQRSFSKQVDDAANASVGRADSIADLPKIFLDNRRFVLDRHVEKSRSASRSSFIL
jgi:hypothetical protein